MITPAHDQIKDYLKSPLAFILPWTREFIQPNTDSAAYGDEQLPDRLRVVHQDGFNRPVQHFDLLRPLLFLVFQNILRKKTRENLASGWAAGRDPRAYAVKCFSHSISQHVVIQSSSGFEPDSFPGIIVGEEESVIWRWGRNMTCRWRRGLSSEVTATRPSPNLVLSGLRGPSPWWSCRRRTPGWTARTASSSPRCTGAHRSLVTKPPSWWVA